LSIRAVTAVSTTTVFLQEKQALDKRIDELEEQTKVCSFVPITVLFSV